MGVIIKNSKQIEKIRISASLAANVLDMITPHVVQGVSTDFLNDVCHDYIVNIQKAIPAPLNYQGFPKSICTSINHVVCHGIPSNKILKCGDIINIDVAVIKDGYHGDTSKMFFVGGRDKASILAKRLVDTTRECLFLGIEKAKPNNTLKDIAAAIESHAQKNNFSVVNIFCGHGIGENFHEPPQVMHCIPKSKSEAEKLNIKLKSGMIFTIEPMINAGKRDVSVLTDGWTAITKDRSLSAQWEHTIMVSEKGSEILSLRKDEESISL
jgi:methionyl aminopeptidase